MSTAQPDGRVSDTPPAVGELNAASSTGRRIKSLMWISIVVTCNFAVTVAMFTTLALTLDQRTKEVRDRLSNLTFHAHLSRGYSFLSQEEYERAIDAFSAATKASKKKSDSSTALAERGMVFLELNNLQGALDDLDRAIQLDSQSWMLYNNRAFVHRAIAEQRYQAKRREDALESIEATIADFTKALELAEGRVYNNKTLLHIYNNRGFARIAIGKCQEAIGDFSKALEVNPDCSVCYNNLGFAKLKLGLYADAEMDLRKAVTLDYRSPHSHTLLGRCLHQLGQLQDALAEFELAIKADVNLPQAYKYRMSSL